MTLFYWILASILSRVCNTPIKIAIMCSHGTEKPAPLCGSTNPPGRAHSSWTVISSNRSFVWMTVISSTTWGGEQSDHPLARVIEGTGCAKCHSQCRLDDTKSGNANMTPDFKYFNSRIWLFEAQNMTPRCVFALTLYVRWTNLQSFLRQLWPFSFATLHWIRIIGNLPSNGEFTPM